MAARAMERIRYLALTIGEHSSVRALDALATLVLIRGLDVASLGVFVIYQSWVALLLMGFPALENILYRKYRVLRNEGRLAVEVGAVRRFNALKLGAAILLTAVLSALPLGPAEWSRRAAALAFAFALPLAQSLYGVYRETLRFELMQWRVTLIAAAQRVALIVVIAAAARGFGGAIEPIAAAGLVVFLSFGLAWRQAACQALPWLRGVHVDLSTAVDRVRRSLGSYVLWAHFNGAVLAGIQTLDVYFLSRRGTGLSEIAVYSVALKAANFFQILPMPFAQVFSVYLGRRADRTESRLDALKLVGLATLGAGVLGLALFLFGHWAAESALAFLARGKFSAGELSRAKEYFDWQLAGVACLTLSFGAGAYVNARGGIRGLTYAVHAPWLVFSAAGYAWAASRSPLEAARFNVPVYAFTAAAHLGYFLWWNHRRAE